MCEIDIPDWYSGYGYSSSIFEMVMPASRPIFWISWLIGLWCFWSLVSINIQSQSSGSIFQILPLIALWCSVLWSVLWIHIMIDGYLGVDLLVQLQKLLVIDRCLILIIYGFKAGSVTLEHAAVLPVSLGVSVNGLLFVHIFLRTDNLVHVKCKRLLSWCHCKGPEALPLQWFCLVEISPPPPSIWRSSFLSSPAPIIMQMVRGN